MKFTLAWLKEHLDTEQPLSAIADKLTMIGLEVESVTDRGKLLAPFTIASVISAEQHPNADRLRVCMVDTGQGAPVQVVCGAPNARTGMKGVFVPPGAFIPARSAASKAAACSSPNSSCKSPMITRVSSSFPPTRRSAPIMRPGPVSTIP
jgi:predicted RNA-binding protein with EMAP domain